MKQCEDITAGVDYSSEEATAALKGAGAGAEVTAAGIFGDIIRIGKR